MTFEPSDDTIKRLTQDARTRRYIVNSQDADELEEALKLRRKNANWEPNEASGSLEGTIDRFEQVVKVEFDTLLRKKCSNLTKLQKSRLDRTKNQKEPQALLGDKNVGPMVVIRDDWIKNMTDQHLSNRKTYGIFSKEEAQQCLVEATSSLLEF